MKKVNLFKVVLFTLLVTFVLSWIIPASSYDGTAVTGTSITPVPLFDLLSNSFVTLYYFWPIVIFLLVVGGFYGVLGTTNAYSNLVQKIAKSFKGKEKLFLGTAIVLYALVASLISLPFALFVFVPMTVSIVLALGYDKLTALATTIGAIIVGIIGSTYGDSIAGNIVNFLSFDLGLNDSIVTKVVILVLGIILLIAYVVNRVEKVSTKTKAEEDYDPLYFESTKAKTGTLAMSIMLGLTAILVLVGFFSWSTVFTDFNYFTEFDSWLRGLTLFSFPIFDNILGSLNVLGKWGYNDLSIVLVLMTLLMAFVYRIKLNEYLYSFAEGAKKLIPAAIVILLAYAVLVVSNSASSSTMVGISPAFFDFFIGLTKDFNLFLLVIPTILASIIDVDPYYVVNFGLAVASSAIGSASNNSLLGLLFQTMYGFTMLWAPTSVILLAGLSYLDVPYTKWLKYIAIFLLQIFAVIMALLVIVLIAG